MNDNANIQNSSSSPPYPMPQGDVNIDREDQKDNSFAQSVQQDTDQTKSQEDLHTPLPPEDSIIQNGNSQSITTSSGEKRLGFSLFLIVGLVLIAIVWSFVGYQYFQNKKIKEKIVISNQKPTATPIPVFSPEQIRIENGNVVNRMPSGETKILAEKKKYPATGITGFLRVLVSPDEKGICLESLSPAPKPALYYSDIEGKNVYEVSKNKKNCLWTNDSKYLIYTSQVSTTSGSDIFVYDISANEEVNLTDKYHVPAGLGSFDTVGLNADGSKIICTYTTGTSENKTAENCEIEIQTREVVIKSSDVD